jgi:hypothetical protein
VAKLKTNSSMELNIGDIKPYKFDGSTRMFFKNSVIYNYRFVIHSYKHGLYNFVKSWLINC